jgi:hypothetical protein
VGVGVKKWLSGFEVYSNKMPMEGTPAQNSRRETLPKEEDGQVVDYLEEDPEIPTQRYAIMSFISPESVIKQKQEFFYEKFLGWLDYDWKVTGLEGFMAFLGKKYSLKTEDLMADMNEFRKVHNAEVSQSDIHEKYQVFLMKNEKDLETEFTEKVEFRTNVRGVKVRRIFANLEEAQMFTKVLQRKYPRDNLYIGKVGCWLPWDPSENVVQEVEYAEKELNEMMRKYKENEVNKDIFFDERKNEKIEDQKKENARRRAAALEEKAAAEKSIMDAPAIHPTEGAIRE